MDDRSRIDIKMRNVFVSWTGNDYALKERIVERLVAGNVTCTVSDGKSAGGSCSGNYVQWSANAAKSANIFLLILTENTLKSTYVPLEIQEVLKIDDAENRIIVVCSSLALWQNATLQYDGKEYRLSDHNISVIEAPNCELTDDILDKIYYKTTDLINNRAYTVYRQETIPKYIDVLSLYSDDAPDRKLNFSDMYVNRKITEKDEEGNVVATHSTPQGLVNSDEIFYICGPAGSGKTQYISQIQSCAGEKTLPITLSCAKVATSTKTLRELMFDEFCKVTGNPIYFSQDNFINLLNNKHLVLVLDGMDEIATQSGVRSFIQKVNEYYSRHSAKTTLFFTGRDEKGANRISLSDKHVRTLYLNRLTEQEIEQLGNNLFVAFGTADKFDGFFVRIRDLQDEIKYNPLLISQLAVIYKEYGDVPQTVVGIFDAISKITLNIDSDKNYTNIPERYLDMIYGISALLKQFAQKRYVLVSNGEDCTPQEIFEELLFEDYKHDYMDRAAFLVEWLLKRSILVDDGKNFYHKMFLEYFTAVYYFEHSILRKRIVDYSVFSELFLHYCDPYWEQVIELFLIKADSILDGNATRNLYSEMLKVAKITDYTLLFDTCNNLANNKLDAQVTLVADILYKSAEKVYPPYGPLFWYVPMYKLYEQTLLAAATLKGNSAALSLARDVCYIYGQKHSCLSVTDKVDGSSLLNSAVGLTGVRKALCEIFYLGDTQYDGGTDIYPRCFNVAETLSFRDNSCGVGGQMTQPFVDELGLYSHESYNQLNDEYIGLIACPYNKEQIERILRAKATRKVTGIVFAPTDDDNFVYPQFYDKTVVCYFPENLCCNQPTLNQANNTQDNSDIFDKRVVLSKRSLNKGKQIHDVSISQYGILYLYGDVVFPFDTAQTIPEGMFFGCQNIRSITLPDSVTEIEDSAFDCSNLAKITLPLQLKKIGRFAFANCDKLTTISLPDLVQQMAEGAFLNCENLQQITLSKQLHKISAYTFDECYSLEKVDIPQSVQEIGESAFEKCESLQQISIPHGVNCINAKTFANCKNLECINLPTSITIVDEYAFAYCKKLQNVCLTNVDKIISFAFEHCDALQSVDIGNDITVIGKESFAYCKNLLEIALPNSLVEINSGAFRDCGLTSVILPQSLQNIAKDAFRNCISLQSAVIPSGITTIEESAFAMCMSLTEIDIPKSVTEIGKDAFACCELLQSIRLHDGLLSIGAWAFLKCINLKQIELPSTVTKIESPHPWQDKVEGGCFQGCINLTNIQLSDNLTTIPPDTFADCESLKEIVIPDSVVEISSKAFANCSNLQRVITPKSLHIIGRDAFKNCQNIQNIQLNDGLTQIEWGAFDGCRQLTSIVIPDTVNLLEENSFFDCKKLVEITAPQKLQQPDFMHYIGLLNDCRVTWTEAEYSALKLPDDVTEVTRDMITNRNVTQIILPQGVQVIADDAFSGCGYLTNVNIPKSVQTIGNRAFAECKRLKKLFLHDAVTTIGESAFENCIGLQELYIPDSVVELGANAFSGCVALKKLKLSNNLTEIREGTFKQCKMPELTVPEGVTDIGADAFDGCSFGTLNLPDTLSNIDYAFGLCFVENGITIPSKVKKLKARTFMFCPTTNITLSEGLEEIDADAFYFCSLVSINIPTTVHSIGYNAFADCYYLKEITVPDSIVHLGVGVFQNCKSLEKVRLPNSISTIPNSLLRNCESLQEIEIPHGVTVIDEDAFRDCKKLRKVIIPNTVTSICALAFSGCESLEEIQLPDSVKSLGVRGGYTIVGDDDEIPDNPSKSAAEEALNDFGYSTDEQKISSYFGEVRNFDPVIGVFSNCVNLEHIHLPRGIAVLKKDLFYGCTRLESVEIPQTVWQIESRVFAGCAGLTSLTIPISTVFIDNDAFADTNMSELTISRNFANDIDRICGKNKPKKINYI